MRIRPAKGFNINASYRADYLVNRLGISVFIYANGNFIAIKNPPSNVDKLNQVTIQVTEEEKLWKRQLYAQIGMPPKYITSLHSVYFQRLVGRQIYNCAFKVYECY